MATGRLKPNDLTMHFPEDREDHLYMLGEDKVTPFVWASEGPTVVREAVEFKPGVRGITYWNPDKTFPLLSVVLFKDGHFLKNFSENTHPYNWVPSPKGSVPRSNRASFRRLIFFLKTGQMAPPPFSHRVGDWGEINLYYFNGSDTKIFVGRDHKGKDVQMEPVEFSSGARGIRIREAGKEKKSPFMAEFVLYKNGTFLKNPEPPWISEGETTQDPTTLFYLGKNEDPPPPLWVRTGNSPRDSIPRGDLDPFRPFLGQIVKNEDVFRHTVKFGDGEFGIQYWIHRLGKPVLPLDGYILFRNDRFLARPVHIPMKMPSFDQEPEVVSNDLSHKCLIYFLKNGEMRPNPFWATLDAKGFHRPYTMDGESVSLYISTLYGKQKVIVVPTEWAPGERGLVYWHFKKGEGIFPLAAFTLFEKGGFLKDPSPSKRLPPVLTKTLKGPAPRSDEADSIHLMAFLLTGEYSPPETIVSLSKGGQDHLYTLGEEKVAPQVGVHFRPKTVVRKAKTFSDGSRGVIYYVREEGKDDFPIKGFRLFQKGHFLEIPQEFPFDLPSLSPNDVPSSTDLEKLKWFYHLATGENPPEPKTLPGGKDGADSFMVLGKEQISLRMGASSWGPTFERKAVTIEPGTRGVSYWPTGVPFPLVSHKLFEGKKFLGKTEIVKYPFNWFQRSLDQVPVALDPATTHLIYFLGSGKEKPSFLLGRKAYNSGEMGVYSHKNKQVKIYLGKEGGKKHILMEPFSFSNYRRGILLWQWDPQQHYSFLGAWSLFENFQFLLEPKKVNLPFDPPTPQGEIRWNRKTAIPSASAFFNLLGVGLLKTSFLSSFAAFLVSGLSVVLPPLPRGKLNPKPGSSPRTDDRQWVRPLLQKKFSIRKVTFEDLQERTSPSSSPTPKRWTKGLELYLNKQRLLATAA